MAAKNIPHSERHALQEWHRDYTAATAVEMAAGEVSASRSLDQDDLDIGCIEKRILELMQETTVADGYCEKCCKQLNTWPCSITQSQFIVSLRPCHTNELEAGSRNACKFCALIFSQLQKWGHLQLFRKIERRLDLLGSDESCSLSAHCFMTDKIQLASVNLPGKVEKVPKSRTYLGCRFLVSMLPTCKATEPGWIIILTPVQSGSLGEAADLPKNGLGLSELMSKWINDCNENHELCRSRTAQKPPSRLLYVRNDPVKLVATKG